MTGLIYHANEAKYYNTVLPVLDVCVSIFKVCSFKLDKMDEFELKWLFIIIFSSGWRCYIFFVVASKPIRFVRVFSDISDFNKRNECMPVEISKETIYIINSINKLSNSFAANHG